MVKIRFKSGSGSSHQQSINTSAVSERYLQNQSLQQLNFVKPNLATYSVDQLYPTVEMVDFVDLF